jgi:hypothetical protein
MSSPRGEREGEADHQIIQPSDTSGQGYFDMCGMKELCDATWLQR